ncbi:MAG: NAD-dependent epimerase/dehydratase family protein [Succinivibrio sp.]|nr:NAD-dependent epimerase/dehydratase family protein [Succinivibrio sp.]
MLKRVLVTGAAGFIGMPLCAELTKRGCEVTGLDDLNNFTCAAQLKVERLKQLRLDIEELSARRVLQTGLLTFELLDLNSAAEVQSLIIDGRFDLVVHLAELTSAQASLLSPAVYYRNNTGGFLNVLEGLRSLPVQQRPSLIFASSSAVYGTCPQGGAREDDYSLLKPRSMKGATNLICERLARTYADVYGVGSVALRLFNIYGPFDRSDTLISALGRAAFGRRPLTLPEGGSALRDYLYLDDAVRALLLVGEDGTREGFECYNLGSGVGISQRDLVELFGALSGQKIEIRQVPLPAAEAQLPQLWADLTKFTARYGALPKQDLQSGLRNLIAWQQARLREGRW